MNKRMKLWPNLSRCQSPIRPATVRAWTLTEMMVTLAVFLLVFAAMVSLQVFGFKINALSSSKLQFSRGSLKALDQIRNQIRGATNVVLIGNYNTGSSNFTAVANGSLAVGNAAQISNNANNYVIFYLNTNTHILYEVTNGVNSPRMFLASSVINSQPFDAENCFGNTNTVGQSGTYTIKMTLLFSNADYLVPTNVYDTYRLESRATPRMQFIPP